MKNIFKYTRGIELVGGAIIENEKGEILMTQSPKWKNKWCFPGGHIEPGETITEALTREGEEETSLKLKALSVIAYGELIGSKDFHRPAHFIFFDIYCKIISGELKLDNKELTSFKWLYPKKALELDLAESFAESIQKFIEYKNKKD